MYIHTVQGRIAPRELGITFAHEHLKVDLSGQKGDPDTRYDDLNAVIVELRELKGQGLGTVVEVTNWGMGRDIEAMIRATEETGLNIVTSTGVYKDPFLPAWALDCSETELAAKMTAEIRQGIEDTGVRAHVIGEVGTSAQGITPQEGKALRAAARAHVETGHPIYTHTTLGMLGLMQIELLKGMGVDPSKVVIGHTDLCDDPDTHLRLADTGCFLGFDTIGKLNYQSDAMRAERIRELVERGHGGQIVLSQDLTRKTHLRSRGGIGYAYLFTSFIPLLLEKGIARQAIDVMLIDNPARFLAVE